MPISNCLEEVLLSIRETGNVEPVRGKIIRSQNGIVYIADEIVYSRSDHSSFIIKVTDEQEALYCLKCTVLTDHQIQKRLATQECEALARLQGVPSVIQMTENFRTERIIYIVTDFYPMTLDKLDKSNLNETQIWFFLWKLLNIAKTIHLQNIIHRDIKPENILIDENGEIVLCDFGLAKLSPDFPDPASGVVVGTPSYSAPEFKTLDYSPKGDTYSIMKVVQMLLDTQERSHLKTFVSSHLSCGERTRPSPAEILENSVFNPLEAQNILSTSLFASISVEKESKILGLDRQTMQAHVLAVALSKIKLRGQDHLTSINLSQPTPSNPMWLMVCFSP
eukprot:GHVP01014871.1.p1 GENE.GHVP01014871.1~~GHVP01014871.1.p1  ORF type:complete len:336 (+),score=55.64 GHVP01014871.1:218-1225(+)